MLRVSLELVPLWELVHAAVQVGKKTVAPAPILPRDDDVVIRGLTSLL